MSESERDFPGRLYRVVERFRWIEGGRPGPACKSWFEGRRPAPGELFWEGGRDIVYEPGGTAYIEDRDLPCVYYRLEAIDDAGRAALEELRAKAKAPAQITDLSSLDVKRVQRGEDHMSTLDDLSRQALIHAFTKGVGGQPTRFGTKIVGLDEMVGLPMYVPIVRSGLPPDEVESLEAAGWAEIFSEWVDILASRWKLHETHLQAALGRVSKGRGCSRDETKRRLVWLGLLEVMASAGDPWSGRVGSGEGSGKVEAVPKEAGLFGQLKWLAQEALQRANRALEDEDERVHRPNGEEELPSDSGVADKATSAARKPKSWTRYYTICTLAKTSQRRAVERPKT